MFMVFLRENNLSASNKAWDMFICAMGDYAEFCRIEAIAIKEM